MDNKSSSPTISIVLPTYNGSRYLEQSIQSCLDQTFSNWELIIVDDASTDDTPEIISRFAAIDQRIKSVRHDKNRKLPAALNTGFALAQGEYFTWTSDDNLFLPEALSEMYQALQEDKLIDIVYADYTRIDEDGRLLEAIKLGSPRYLITVNSIGACFLYKRAVHERLGGYSEGLFTAEDYDFWLRASEFFNFKKIDRQLYLYRAHEGSLSSTQTDLIRKKTEDIIKANLARLGWPTDLEKSNAYLRLVRLAVLGGRRKDALRYFVSAMKLVPRRLMTTEALVVLKSIMTRT